MQMVYGRKHSGMETINHLSAGAGKGINPQAGRDLRGGGGASFLSDEPVSPLSRPVHLQCVRENLGAQVSVQRWMEPGGPLGREMMGWESERKLQDVAVRSQDAGRQNGAVYALGLHRSGDGQLI